MCPRCTALNDMMNAFYSYVGHADYYQFVTEKLTSHAPHSTEAMLQIAARDDDSRLKTLARTIKHLEQCHGTGNLVPSMMEMVKRRIAIHPAPRIAV